MKAFSILNKRQVYGYQLRDGIQSFAHHMCKAMQLPDIQIKWNQDISTAAINSWGDIYLAAIKDDAIVSRKLIVKYVGFVLHELLHRKYTDFTVKSNIQYLNTLLNAIEDIWIERNGIKDSVAGNIEDVLTLLITEMVEDAIISVKDWSHPAQYPFILAIRGRTYAPNTPCPGNIAPLLDEAIRRISKSQSTADNMVIAQWLYGELKQNQPDRPEQPEKSKGKDRPDDSQPEESQPGTEDGASDSPESPTSDDPGQDGTDVPNGPGKEKGKGQGKGPGKGQGFGDEHGAPVREGQEARSAEPTIELDKEQMGLPDIGFTSRKINQFVENQPIRVVNVPGKIRYELKKILDNTAHEEYASNKRKGHLNVHALPRIAVKDSRIFERRFEIGGIQTAVIVCLDCSGSMRGFNMDCALDTIIAVVDALDKAGSAWSIQLFEGSQHILCDFGTNLQKAKQAISNVYASGGTDDLNALRTAHNRLLRRSEDRRIVMVITDSDTTYSAQASKTQVTTAANLGITSIGIGIGAGSRRLIQEVYGKDRSVVILDPSDLAKAAFSQLKMVK